MQKKYPDLSPYNFTGNNLIVFVDYNGQDFGVKIDNKEKTIIIVANIYTTTKSGYSQAQKAAEQWNQASATVDGYSVCFQIKVEKPQTVTDEEAIERNPEIVRRNGKINQRKLDRTKSDLANRKAVGKITVDEIGNVFAGNSGTNSEIVSGERFTGGQTANGVYADMNTHEEKGDLGNFVDLVAHEFGHFFGLDDAGKGPYYSNGGVMEYAGTDLKPISKDDITNIIKFAKNALSGQTKSTDAKVKIIENTGKSDESNPNPVGVKGE